MSDLYKYDGYKKKAFCHYHYEGRTTKPICSLVCLQEMYILR